MPEPPSTDDPPSPGDVNTSFGNTHIHNPDTVYLSGIHNQHSESPRRKTRGHYSVWLGLGLTASVVIALAVTAYVTGMFGGHGPQASGKAYPISGDASEARATDIDLNYPDGTEVGENQTITKKWVLHNTGTVTWIGRQLRFARYEKGDCQAVDFGLIPTTVPGGAAEIAVQVRTSSHPDRCKIWYRMTDDKGSVVFPANQGIWTDLKVN